MPNSKGRSAIHMKKRVSRKKKILNIHMYGIFDVRKKTMVKVGLDKSEIDMDMALMGGLGDNFAQCEFDVSLRV
jgi:hypothetical protein